MSTAPSSPRTGSHPSNGGGASVAHKLLLIAEAGFMFATFWVARQLERVSPRSTIWIDRWMGRMLQKIEQAEGASDPEDHSTKETHGQG